MGTAVKKNAFGQRAGSPSPSLALRDDTLSSELLKTRRYGKGQIQLPLALLEIYI